MDYIAQRAKSIDASRIRRIWQMAGTMTDPVDFSIGQPDFATPEPAKTAAIEAIRADKNTYTVTAGLDELREPLAERIRAELDWQNPSILITAGVSGALLLGLMATVNPGDEVLMADPYFVSYRHLVNLLGGKCVFVDSYPDFQLDTSKLAQSITPRTKLLMLNSPANPTGVVYSPEQLEAVAQIARRHELLVFSDEIYQQFSYEQPARSIAEFYEKTVVMRGFSKTYGMPGWRLGYVAMAAQLETLFNQMATLQQYTFVCAPHPCQIGALAALGCDMSAQVAAYRHKRDLIYEGLKDSFGLVKPAGAFYAFVPAPGDSASDFVARAIKNNVLIVPGEVFSRRDSHFRISYATSDDDIRKGVERLCRLADH